MADLKGYLKVFSNIAYDNVNYAIDNDFIMYTESNSQRIIIGQNSNVSIITTSNKVGFFKSNPNYTVDVLGNINLTGNLTSNGINKADIWYSSNSNLYIYIPSNIGIGKSNLQYSVDIVGNVNITGDYRKSNNPYILWFYSSSNIFQYGSNIGIWNSNPQYRLDVGGDINFTGTLRSNTVQYPIRTTPWLNASSNVFILGSNVGINNSNPLYTLDVIGDMNIAGMINRYDKNYRYYTIDESDSNVLSTQCNNSILKYSPVKWFATIDGLSNDIINGIAVDSSNNVYIAGAYSSCNTGNSKLYNYDNTLGYTLPVTSGAQTAYAAKYNSNGIVQWYVIVDSPGCSNNTMAVTTDSQQNVYITGTYTCNATIYNSNNVSSGFSLRTPTVPPAAFAIKYNSNGICQWFVSMDGGGIKTPFQIQTDSDYNVYFGGVYTSNNVLYNSNNTLSSFTLRNNTTGASYLAKYDSNGVAQWFVTIDGSGAESNMGIKVDNSNFIYVVGKYGAGTTTLYNSNNTSSGISYRAAASVGGYIVKYDSNGTIKNFANFDGAGIDIAYSVDVDNQNNVYVGGVYTSNCTIYNSSNYASTLIPRSSSNQAVIVIKYNSNLNAQWFVTIDGSGNDSMFSVSVDSNQNLYLCGSYFQSNPIVYNSNNINSGLRFVAPINTNSASYVVKYDSNGVAQWYTTLDGTNSDSLNSIVVSEDTSNLYVGGTINGANSNYNLYYNSIRVTNNIRAGSNNAGILLNLYTDNKNYKLISNLSNNGFYKVLTNVTSSNIPVNIRNSNDTTTIKTVIVPSFSNKILTWYNSNWYENIDKFSWLTNSSNQSIYIIGSNVGFGKSNPNYITEITGDINVTGSIRNYSNLTGNYLTYEVATRYISTTSNASVLNNFNIVWNGTIMPLSGYVTGKTLSIGSNGNIYIAGGYSNTSNSAILYNSNETPSGITFNNNSNNSLSNGIYFAKYNSNCQAQWVITMDNVGASGIINSIATDCNENIFVAGTYTSVSPILLVSTSNTGPSNIYPPSAMTESNTYIKSNLYIAAASSSRTTTLVPWKVFNKVIASDPYAKWQSLDNCYSSCNATTNPAFPDGYIDPNYFGEWLRLDMPFPIYPNSLSFGGDIMAFRMYGWNYSGNWDVLLDITNRSNAAVFSNIDIYNININPPKIYQRYALRFNKSRNAAGFGRACVMWVEINGTKLPSLPMSSNYSAFLIKYDSNGVAKWATGVDSTNADTGTSVAVDSGGNSYLTGVYYKSNVSVYDSNQISSNVTLRTPTGLSNFGYIVKYNPSGISQWSICTDGNYSTIDDIRIDSSNSIYVGGTSILGNVAIYNSQNSNDATIRASDGGSSYLIKFDSSGITKWFTSIGSPSNNSTLSSSFQTNAIAIDSNCNSYIVGQYNNFGVISQIYNSNNIYSGSNLRVTTGSSTGSNAGFLVKFDSNGSCKWFTTLDSTANDSFTSVAVDLNGNVFITGCNMGSNPFIYNSNNTPSPYRFTNSNSSAYVLKFDSNGILNWFTVYHTVESVQSRSVKTDSNGYIYVVGNYSASNIPGLITIGNNTCGNRLMQTSNSLLAAYIIKYDTYPFTYKLLNNASNCFNKYLINTASNDVIVDIRDSNDTTTLRSIVIPSNSNKILTWYGSNWYGISDFTNWSNLSSAANSFVIGSNVGIGKSNAAYPIDAIGDINLTGTFVINGSRKQQNQWRSNANNLYIIGSNIGIHKSNLTYALDIDGSLNLTGVIRSNTIPISVRMTQWSNTSSNIFIMSSNVGINTSNPQYTVDVNGSVNIVGSFCNSLNLSNLTWEDYNNTVINTTSNLTILKQPIQWYASVDGVGTDNFQSIAIDQQKNVYVAGLYQSNTTSNVIIYNANNIDSGKSLRVSSNNAAYLVKYNSNGICQWFVSVDGSGADNGQGCAVDVNGNVYLSGYYLNSTTNITIFNSNNTPSGYTFRNSTGQAGFVVKYDSNGVCQWFISVDGSGSDGINRIKTDAYCNLYIIGNYSAGNPIFYNSNNTASSYSLRTSSNGSAFAAKYDSNGVCQWFTSIDGASTDSNSGLDIDLNMNLYVCGVYGSNATIYNSNNTSSGYTFRAVTAGGASFIVKYDSNGVCQGFVSIDGTSTDNCQNVSIDTNGNILISGIYGSAATIYTLNNTSSGYTLRTPGGNSAYVVKYDSNFNYQMAMTIDGTATEYGIGLATDISNNIYLSGQHQGNSTIYIYDSNGTSNLTSYPSSNIAGFIVKYNSNGVAQWVVKIDGFSTDYGSNCAVAPDGSTVYLSGSYTTSNVNIYFNNTNYGSFRTASSTAAYIVAINTQDNYNYRLLNLGSNKNGYYKYIINTWPNDISLSIKDSNDSQVIKTLNLPANSNKLLFWYNSNWIESADTGQWISNSNTIYIMNSNVGIRTSPSYTLDINGDVNVTGKFRMSNLLTNNYLTTDSYESNSIPLSNNLYILQNADACTFSVIDGQNSLAIVKAVANDNFGNIYVGGHYSTSSNIIYNASNIASGLTMSNPIALYAGYLIKYNSNGIAQWFITIDGIDANNNIGIGSIAIDSNLNVYVGGTYSNSSAIIYNSNGSSSAMTMRTPSGTSPFAIKYDSNGLFQWYVCYDGASNEGFGISTGSGNIYIDSDNNLYLSGAIQTTPASIYDSNNVLSSLSITTGTGCVIKYNSNGIAQWFVSAGIGSINSIYVDNFKNLYLTGNYSSTYSGIIYNSNNVASSLTIPSSGSTSSYAIKYNSNGTVQWYVRSGQGGAIHSAANSLIVDSNLNLYMTGYTNGNEVIYNSNNVASGVTTGFSNRSPYIYKFNSNGILQWYAGLNCPWNGIGINITLDTSNNVYLSGYYTGISSSINNIVNSNLVSSGFTLPSTPYANAYQNSFIIKYNSNGFAQWWGVLAGYKMTCYSGLVDNNYNVYISGTSFANSSNTASNPGSILFYNSETRVNTLPLPQGIQQGFVVRYALNPNIDYKLKSDLGTSNNGFFKNILNVSPYLTNINIRDSNDSTTLQTFNLPSYSNKLFTWYESNWYALTDSKGSWSNNSSNVFIIGSNVGIGKSNPVYPLDVLGDINSSNGYIKQNGNLLFSWFYNSSNIYSINNVAIGKNNATYNLDVEGDINFTGTLRSNTVQYPIRMTQWSNTSSNVFILSSNVCINKSNSLYSLDLTGDLNVSGNINKNSYNINNLSYTNDNANLLSTTSNLSVLYANQLNWYAEVDGGVIDTGTGVAIDASNNIYISGTSQCNLLVPTVIYNLNGTPSGLVITSYQNLTQAAYAVKYNSNGIAQWYVMVESLGADTTTAIEVDNNMNIYISGNYQSNATIFNSNGTSSGYSLRAPTGGTAGYVVKYDSNGICQMFISIDGSSADVANRIYVNNSNLFVCGTYASNTIPTFYNSNNSVGLTAPSYTSTAFYTAKYDLSGAIQWYITITLGAGTSAGYVRADSNYVYVCGNYSSNFANGSLIYNSNGASSGYSFKAALTAGFMVRYDHNGVCKDFITVDTTTGVDVISSVITDNNNNVYVVGNGKGSTIYDSNNNPFPISMQLTSASFQAFAIKFDSNLNLNWFVLASPSSSTCTSPALSVDSNLNLYMLINSAANVVTIFDSNNTPSTLPNINMPVAGGSASMIKFNSNGIAQWYLTMDSAGTDTFSNCKINLNEKNLYIIGSTGTSSGAASIYVNNNLIASTRRNSNSAGILLNVNTDLINYKLLPLNISSNGFIKYITNTALTDGILNIRNSNDTTTLRTSSMFSYSNNLLSWYGSNWYEYTNTALWGSNSSNLYLLNSNVCIAKSNSVYSLDVHGDINSSNFLLNKKRTTLLSSFNETKIISNLNSNFYTLSNNVYNIPISILDNTSSNGAVTCQCVSYDNIGNMYVCGNYTVSNVVIYNFDNTNSGFVINSPSNGVQSAYLIKYNSNGIAQWFTNIDGAGYKELYSLAVDSNYNIYVGGTYAASNPLIIYNSNNTSSGLSIRAAGGDYGLYTVKYNSNGICQWFSSVDSTSTDGNPNVPVTTVIDSNNNFYFGGFVNNATIYDSNNTSIITIINASGRSATCIKYDSNGIFQWYVTVAGGSFIYTYAVAIDANMNVYMGGNYATNAATIYNSNGSPSGSTLRAAPNQTSYAVKYNSNGIMQWFVSVDCSGDDFCYGLKVDSNYNLYMSGIYTSSAIIYNSNNTASPYTLPSTGAPSAPYLIQFNSNGVCNWYSVLSPLSTASRSLSLCIDTQQNVYMSGYYVSASSNVFILNSNNSSSNLYLLPTGSTSYRNAFIIKYDSNGICRWNGIIGPGNALVNGNSIDIDSSNNLLIGGTYTGKFSNAAIYSLNELQSNSITPSYGTSNAFIAKFVLDTTSYKLLNNLSSSNNGLYKSLLNVYNIDLTVNIRDSNDTTTLQTVNLPTKSNKIFTWYGSNWYGITDTWSWSNYSSNVYLIGSNVGIGLSNTNYQLQLSTDSAAKPSTNTWTISSDERIKYGIILADLDTCVEIIKTIPLKKYTLRTDLFMNITKDLNKLGWIAQDVESVFPKAVEKINQYGIEDCRTLDTDQLYATMYGCLQKQQIIIENLEQMNRNLSLQIIDLETRIRK